MKRPAANARIHELASSLSVPAATPTRNPRTAVRADKKFKRRAEYHESPVDSRIT